LAASSILPYASKMTDKDRPRRQVRERRNLLRPPPPPKPAEKKVSVGEAVAELIEQIKRQEESD
jgi:hypothetical protein